MTEQLLAEAVKEGIWALLFIFLLIYVINTTKQQDEKQAAREEHYQKLLESLTEKFAVIETVKSTLDEVLQAVKQ